MKYSSGLVSESFWFVEMKDMLVELESGVDWDELKGKCLYENFYGGQKEYRANRIYGYLKNRILSLDQGLIKLFHNQQITSQKIINLMGIAKQNKLFFEFLYEVYREKLILGDNVIEMSQVNRFFTEKQRQDDVIASWKEGTLKRLGSNYLNYMSDAGLILISNKERKISRISLDYYLDEYLKANDYPMWKIFNGIS